MDLNKCRIIINEIDDEMKKLFLKRMRVVSEVAKYKKDNNYPIFDSKREEEMKKRLVNDIDFSLQKEYLAFLENILILSKEYQKKKIAE